MWGSRLRAIPVPIAIAIAMLLAAEGALAQAVERIGLSLTLARVASSPGPSDPGAAPLPGLGAVHVLDRRHLDLGLEQVGGYDLPTGKHVELRPLSVTPSGVLISVDIPGTLQTDVRVKNRKQVLIGLDRYQDGKLLLTLQPDY